MEEGGYSVPQHSSHPSIVTAHPGDYKDYHFNDSRETEQGKDECADPLSRSNPRFPSRSTQPNFPNTSQFTQFYETHSPYQDSYGIKTTSQPVLQTPLGPTIQSPGITAALAEHNAGKPLHALPINQRPI